MPDTSNAEIQPVPPVSGTAAVQPVRPVRPEPFVGQPDQHEAAPDGHEVAAITGGNLPHAYAQVSIDPDTRDLVIQVRDSLTDEVIREYPSREIEAMNHYMAQYAETLARRQAAKIHDESAT